MAAWRPPFPTTGERPAREDTADRPTARVSAASRDPGPAHATRQRAGGRDRAGLCTPLASLFPSHPTPHRPAADGGVGGDRARGEGPRAHNEKSSPVRSERLSLGLARFRPSPGEREITTSIGSTRGRPRVCGREGGGGRPAEDRNRRRGPAFRLHQARPSPPRVRGGRCSRENPTADQRPTQEAQELPGVGRGGIHHDRGDPGTQTAGRESTTRGRSEDPHAHTARLLLPHRPCGNQAPEGGSTLVGTFPSTRGKSQRTGPRGRRPQEYRSGAGYPAGRTHAQEARRRATRVQERSQSPSATSTE